MAANKNLKDKVISMRNNGMKMTDIASELKCSLATVKYHCSKNGLNGKYTNMSITKEKFENIKLLLEKGSRYQDIVDELKVSISTIKRYKNKSYDDVVNNRSYMNSYMIDKRKTLKLKAIEYKGGCCSICGYSKSVLSLSFHHTDTNNKDFQISGITKSWEKIRIELDKCILVCNNCHGEIHEKMNMGV